jgi:hypothetical protein
MKGTVIIAKTHRYVGSEGADGRDNSCLAGAPEKSQGDPTMRKTALTILGSALLAASVAQAANAAEHKARKAYRAPAPVSETVRNSNAYWSAPSVQSDWSRYQNGGLSAPAGH